MSRRPFPPFRGGKYPSNKSGGPSHSEDTQPNEALASRGGVPQIISKVPARQRDNGWAWRGARGRGGSRGGMPVASPGPSTNRAAGTVPSKVGGSQHASSSTQASMDSSSGERIMTIGEVWLMRNSISQSPSSQGGGSQKASGNTNTRTAPSQSPVRDIQTASPRFTSSTEPPIAFPSATAWNASPKLPSPPVTPDTTPAFHAMSPPGTDTDAERAAKRKATFELIRAKRQRLSLQEENSPLRDSSSPLARLPTPSSRIKEEPVVPILPPALSPTSLKEEPDLATVPPPLHHSPSRTSPTRTLQTLKPEPESPSVQSSAQDSPSSCRRLVTSGSLRVHPVPANCLKSDPNWKRNREKWAEEQRAELRKKGVILGRSFIREDGLVIDWTSRMPVYSDTLCPPTPPPSQPPLSHESPPPPIAVSSSPRQPSFSPPPQHAPHRLHLPRQSLPSPSQAVQSSAASPFTLSQSPSFSSQSNHEGPAPPRTRSGPSLNELRAAMRAKQAVEKSKNKGKQRAEEIIVIDSSSDCEDVTAQENPPEIRQVEFRAPSGTPQEPVTSPTREAPTRVPLSPPASNSMQSCSSTFDPTAVQRTPQPTHISPDPMRHISSSPPPLQPQSPRVQAASLVNSAGDRQPQNATSDGSIEEVMQIEDDLMYVAGPSSPSAVFVPLVKEEFEDMVNSHHSLRDGGAGLELSEVGPAASGSSLSQVSSLSNNEDQADVPLVEPPATPEHEPLLLSHSDGVHPHPYAQGESRDIVVDEQALSEQLSTNPSSPDPVPPRAEATDAIGDLPPEITSLAEEFIRRYVQLFDSDRPALASAYASNATFSYRVLASSARSSTEYSSFAPVEGSRDVSGANSLATIHTSRLSIMSTLLSFSDSYKLISDGEPVDMPCDLTYVKMGSEAGPGVCEVILLVCYCKLRWCAEQARSADERDIGMEMSFVLRRKEADAADRETEGLWSLLVVAHQMVIRVNHVPDPV